MPGSLSDRHRSPLDAWRPRRPAVPWRPPEASRSRCPLALPVALGALARQATASNGLRRTEEQSVENQRPELERLAEVRGLELASVYEEQASAAKSRPEYERMMNDARRGAWQCLVVWSLDRFRRSMVGNLSAVLELDRLGIQVVSVPEPWLDSSGPVRSLLVAIFSWVAEQERTRIVERTKAGLERARRKGVHVGRPPKAVDLTQARALRASGLSLREIATELGVSPATIYRAFKADGLRRQACGDVTRGPL